MKKLVSVALCLISLFLITVYSKAADPVYAPIQKFFSQIPTWDQKALSQLSLTPNPFGLTVEYYLEGKPEIVQTEIFTPWYSFGYSLSPASTGGGLPPLPSDFFISYGRVTKSKNYDIMYMVSMIDENMDGVVETTQNPAPNIKIIMFNELVVCFNPDIKTVIQDCKEKREMVATTNPQALFEKELNKIITQVEKVK